MKERVSICAVIAVRNEFSYLRVLLPLLAEQNIDVVIIDNDSSDNSHDLYSLHKNNPIIAVENLPYIGLFSLSEQLAKKKEVYSTLQHDWLIHQDADEVLEHHRQGDTLRDALQEADDAGFNAINFEEFVFLPESGGDYDGRNYYQELLRYYFFERHKNALNRAWKRIAGFNNGHLGGHVLSGDNIKMFPENHVLRHYIALNEERVKKKYTERVFAGKELDKGWHKDRFNIERESLSFPQTSEYLLYLSSFDAKDFVRSRFAQDHYWQW